MQVGINYPWLSDGADLGLPVRHRDGVPWHPRMPWRAVQPNGVTRLRNELLRLRDLGITVVRWFLLCDGRTYGIGPQAPHRSHHPTFFDPGHGTWHFDPLPLSPEFEADFVTWLEAFRIAGMHVLPVLTNHQMFFDGHSIDNNYVMCGRQDIVSDAVKRERFLDLALGRLLQLSIPYRASNTIYAWELVNEPEMCTQRSGVGWLDANPFSADRTVARADMLAFIRSGARRITNAGFHATIGFMVHGTLSNWDSAALGNTLHQFHYYGSGAIPAHARIGGHDVIVGEIATARHNPWPELRHLGNGETLTERLRLLEAKGYPMTMMWAHNRGPTGTSSSSDWSIDRQNEVQRFIRSHAATAGR